MNDREISFEILKKLDKDILNPKKLMIIIVLYLVGPKTMSQLVKATGLSWGDLDTHLRKLRDRGIVELSKKITPQGVRTVVRLTPYGVKLFLETVTQLEHVLKSLHREVQESRY